MISFAVMVSVRCRVSVSVTDSVYSVPMTVLTASGSVTRKARSTSRLTACVLPAVESPTKVWDEVSPRSSEENRYTPSSRYCVPERFSVIFMPLAISRSRKV